MDTSQGSSVDVTVPIYAQAQCNKSRKRSFDAAFKLKAVEYAESINSNRGAGRKFGVNERQVRDWRKQKKELEDLPSKKKRLEGGGRKAALPKIEKELVEWVNSLRAVNLRVTHTDIQIKALELNQSMSQADFTASRGWLEKFLKRNHLSLCRRMTVSE